MLKQQIADQLTNVLKQVCSTEGWEASEDVLNRMQVEQPRHEEHGDYAVNVAPLAKVARLAPPQIATKLLEPFQAALPGTTIEIAGAFLNFRMTQSTLADSVVKLLTDEHPGQNTFLKDTYCLLEFVSANPTGPLHIGHGRWIALGDTLARILTQCGATVTREFYINDAGVQIRNIAASVWYRCLEALETGGKLPEPVEGQPYAFYPGDYVKDIAQSFLKSNELDVRSWDSPSHEPPDEAIKALSQFAMAEVLAEQKALIERCRTHFDHYFHESSLHQSGAIDKALNKLREGGHLYDQEGAVWFKTTAYGDDQDRVLVKTDGSYTYLAPDIAYHDEKYSRPVPGKDNQPYNLFINIWGADHHGYIPRMRAGITALGYDASQFEVLLGQLVNLIIDGERTRMGKRKKMLSLEDLVEEVGVDALRYWMVSRSADTALDFDVQLATSKTDENPVFYVQYAHARCAGILRNALEPRFDSVEQQELPPVLQQGDWEAYAARPTAGALAEMMDNLDTDEALVALRRLVLKLDGFEDRVVAAAAQRSPHVITDYLVSLAADFHKFYSACRIINPDASITQCRLLIVLAVKKVLAEGLELLGVSAPERM